MDTARIRRKQERIPPLTSPPTAGERREGAAGSFVVISIWLIHRIADDWAGHAVAAAPAAAQLGPDDGDDLDAFFTQQRVRVGVAVVGENHARRCANQVGAAVPLRALA